MSKKNRKPSNTLKNNLEDPSSFSNLMLRSERTHGYDTEESSDDIDDMINEKRKNTEELAKELEMAKEEYNNKILEKNNTQKKQLENIVDDDLEENIANVQMPDLTRQAKFNFEDVKSKNMNVIMPTNIIGVINLVCIGFYIYLLTFTNYQDTRNNYLIAGAIIVLSVLFFGLSAITGKKIRSVFNILNILTILAFISFNIYILV